jgi:hypothetical protein
MKRKAPARPIRVPAATAVVRWKRFEKYSYSCDAGVSQQRMTVGLFSGQT